MQQLESTQKNLSTEATLSPEYVNLLRYFLLLLVFVLLTQTNKAEAVGQTIPQPTVTLNFQLITGEGYAEGSGEVVTNDEDVITTTIPATDAGGTVTLDSLGSVATTVRGTQPFEVGITHLMTDPDTSIGTVTAGYRRVVATDGRIGKLEQVATVFSTHVHEQRTGAHDFMVAAFSRGSETFVQLIKQEDGFYFVQLRSNAVNSTLRIADTAQLTESITYQGEATTKLIVDSAFERPNEPDSSISIELGTALPLEISGHRVLLTITSIDLKADPISMSGTVQSLDTGISYTFTGSDPNSDLRIALGKISFSLVPTPDRVYFLPLISQ